MASVKNRIVDYLVSASCLAQVSGLPAGLTVGRGKTTPMQLTGHPRVDVYVGPEIKWQPVGTVRTGTPILRGFTAILDIRVIGAIPDEALDPIEVWCEARLFADETMGGLATGVIGWRVEQDARQLDKNYALSTIYADIEFATPRGNPELTGNGT